MDPHGKNWCGHLVPRESCYCRDGFVRNSANICVRAEQCGCRKPDGSGVIGVGQTVISHDCKKRYTCAGPQEHVRIDNLPGCGHHAQCRGDAQGQPKCFCRKGYTGDGQNCRPIDQTTRAANPCSRAGVCGRGTVCQNQNGQAVCLCNGRIIPRGQTCCNREFRTL